MRHKKTVYNNIYNLRYTELDSYILEILNSRPFARSLKFIMNVLIRKYNLPMTYSVLNVRLNAMVFRHDICQISAGCKRFYVRQENIRGLKK